MLQINENTEIDKELLYAPLSEVTRLENIRRTMNVGGIFLMLSFLILGLLLAFTTIELVSYNSNFGIFMFFVGMSLYFISATVGYKNKLYNKIFSDKWKIQEVGVDATHDDQPYIFVKSKFTEMAFLVYDKESAEYFRSYVDKIINKKPFFKP